MTRSSLFAAAAALLFAATATAADAVEWSVDPGHSHVGFAARHLGVAKVRGEFKTFTAKIQADPKTGKITALEAEVDAKSVDTGIAKRDEHLRSDDFFGADQYPKMKMVLKSIKWNGNKFTATVALTIRDVTKDVKFQGELLGVQTVNFGQGPHLRAGYEATAKINRKDFGLKFAGIAEGVSIVGDEVEINLGVELIKQQPAS